MYVVLLSIILRYIFLSFINNFKPTPKISPSGSKMTVILLFVLNLKYILGLKFKNSNFFLTVALLPSGSSQKTPSGSKISVKKFYLNFFMIGLVRIWIFFTNWRPAPKGSLLGAQIWELSSGVSWELPAPYIFPKFGSSQWEFLPCEQMRYKGFNNEYLAKRMNFTTP